MSIRLMCVVIAAVAAAQPPPPGGGGGNGVWVRDAFFGEAQTFDGCMGHQPQSGMYHHHANPVCLRAQLDDNLELVRSSRVGPTYREKAAPWKHSPILGWAFDGFPIYGPYGYSDPRSPSSEVKRMKSSFRLRAIERRDSLPRWALAHHPGLAEQLTAAQQGPEINATFPLGRYVEDYEFVEGLGDLDVRNGRFAITPDYPNGTYAYFITIDDEGRSAFPHILGLQYHGETSSGNARAVPADARDGTPSTDPTVASWATRNSKQEARTVSAFNPAAGESATWPFEAPAGFRANGGVATPTLADVQRVRVTDAAVYVNSNNLASYTMGPWFEAQMAGGVFMNLPASQNNQFQIQRSPREATARVNTGLGPVGMWVNGVAVFNVLDGASYNSATRADGGGGTVNPHAIHVSAASLEPGPLAAGSQATATAMFGARFAATAAEADSADWPTALGGVTVNVRDSSGVTRPARLGSVSESRVTYQVPPESATGFATVVVNNGASQVSGNINIAASYPHLFPVDGAVEMGAGDGALPFVVRATGRGKSTSVTATIDGEAVEVMSVGEGGAPGIDAVTIAIPRSMAGRGVVGLVVTVDGRRSNAIDLAL
jgi:hypothetical protein